MEMRRQMERNEKEENEQPKKWMAEEENETPKKWINEDKGRGRK